MPRPNIPTPLEELGNRPFSLYPAIWNIEHNEWRLRSYDWDEISVINTKSNSEVFIPRAYVSGVSSAEEPVVIVGLRKELEFREGVLLPRIQRVIEMPQAVNETRRWFAPEPEPGRLAPVVGIRVESDDAPPVPRSWIVRVAAGVVSCIVGLVILRDGTSVAHGRLFIPPFLSLGVPPKIAVPLTVQDDFISVVNKLGYPAETRSRISAGREFYLLRYPNRGYVVVLTNARLSDAERDAAQASGEFSNETSRESANYVGALGRGDRVVHSIKLPDGRDSTTLLMSLR